MSDAFNEQAFRRRVDAELCAFLDARAAAWPEPPPMPVFAALRRFVLAPGKRLRPMFCYWGWRAAGGGNQSAIVAAAASLELFHAAMLIHDDVMDRSQLRRGEPALHRALAGIHRDRGLRGDADWYGISAAIDCGDSLIMWADEMYRTCGLGWRRLRAGYPCLSDMRSRTCAGQLLDLGQQLRGEGSVDGALRVIRYKTAAYTVEGPLCVGAALAGAGPDLIALLGAVGRPLGDAFQLRDDLLGVFGDPALTGKPHLDDLREGKQTVLVALTRAAADAEQRREFDARHGRMDLTEHDAQQLRAIMMTVGAPDQVERLIADRTEVALAALERARLDPAVALGLKQLIRSAARRTS